MNRLYGAAFCLLIAAVCAILVIAALTHSRIQRTHGTTQPAPDTRECC